MLGRAAREGVVAVAHADVAGSRWCPESRGTMVGGGVPCVPSLRGGRPVSGASPALRRRPKYSEAVIWGNSRCFSMQETLPKASFFGKDRSGEERQNKGLG